MEMTSTRPYLLRAFYEWIVDNRCTPHVVVDATREGVEVPREYVEKGQIVLNISPTSVVGLELGEDWVSFSARFGGVARQIMVPVAAVLGIYARETNRGISFDADPEAPPPASAPDSPKAARPSLKVVK